MDTTAVRDTITSYKVTVTESGTIIVLRDGTPLRDSRTGLIRTFKTRNSARKRIARERSGDFHS